MTSEPAVPARSEAMGSPETNIVVTTLGDVVDVVSSLTANDAAVVAVVDHMLRSRTARRLAVASDPPRP
jgi:hypothetical protein